MSLEMLQILINSSIKDGQISDFDRKLIYQKAQQLGISQQKADEMINNALNQQPTSNEELGSGFIYINEEQPTPQPPTPQPPTPPQNQQPPKIENTNNQSSYTSEQSKFTDIKPLSYQGAMSIVCQAKQYGKLIIIKRIKPEYKNDLRYRELFMREFENAYHLDHPHIIRLLDKGEDAEGPYYTMEFVDGRPLTQLITPNGMNNTQLAEKIFRQILDALSYVHKKQIIHRDLKPDNIYITYKGDNVKILDFGLASADYYEDFMQKVGTPKYASPEQMQKGYAADQRADIYSVGKIFLEMLTGSIDQTNISKIQNPVYKQIVQKATASNPDDRFNNCEEIINLLNNPNLLSNQSSQKTDKTTTDTKIKSKSSLLYIILGILGLVVGAALYFLVFNKKDGSSIIPNKKEVTQKADSLYNAGLWHLALEEYNKISKKNQAINDRISEIQPAVNKFNEAEKVYQSKNIARSQNLYKQLSQEYPRFKYANDRYNECQNIIKNAKFESLRPVKDASGDKYGMTDGTYIIIDYQFDKIHTDYYLAYQIGLIPVQTDGKWGFIAKNKEIVQPQFTHVPESRGGGRLHYIIKENGKNYRFTTDVNGAPAIETD